MADNEEKKAELQLDLEELKDLQSKAKRLGVLSFLSRKIRKVDSKLSKLGVPPSIPIKKSRSRNAVKMFKWVQDNENIKLHLSFEGVASDQFDRTIKPRSVDITVYDRLGNSYRYAIPKLSKEIIPEKSKVEVTGSLIEITLAKSSEEHWSDVCSEEDKTQYGPNRGRE